MASVLGTPEEWSHFFVISFRKLPGWTSSLPQGLQTKPLGLELDKLLAFLYRQLPASDVLQRSAPILRCLAQPLPHAPTEGQHLHSFLHEAAQLTDLYPWQGRRSASYLGKMSDPAALTTVPWPSWNTCSSKSMPEGVRCTLRPITFSILHPTCLSFMYRQYY